MRRNLRWWKTWLGLGLGLVAVVCYQSLTPTPIEPPDIDSGDKLGHALVYFVLMGWFVQLYKAVRFPILAICFIAMGAIIEVLQGQTSYRAFEYGDMLANSTGVLLAWVLGYSGFQNLLARFERIID